MTVEIHYIIQRKKDSMYFHRKDMNGRNWFVSGIKEARTFSYREQAKTCARDMQNWLKRPKFKILQVERRTGRR